MDNLSSVQERESLQKDINTIIKLLDSEAEKEEHNSKEGENHEEEWLTCELLVQDVITDGATVDGTGGYNSPPELDNCENGQASTSKTTRLQGDSCIGEFLHIPDDGNVLTIMPNTPELCLLFNQAYQGMVHETISKLQTMLENNREQQRVINEELDECRKRGRPTKKIRIRSRPITLFAAPYFRDIHQCIPPPNEDTKIKELTRECNSYTGPPRPWLAAELKRLIKAVKANAKQLAMEPLMSRKEYLCEKLTNNKLNKKEEKELKKKIKSTEDDLKRINDLPERNLLEPQGQRLDWLKISAVDMEGQKTPEECELMWNNYLHPNINREKWSKAEDDRLKEIAEKYQFRNWDDIAEELKTNRTAIQCLERFQSELNLNLQKGPWSKEEDEILKAVVEACRIGNFVPWNLVAYYVEGRKRSQIINRWTRTLQPGIKRGIWSKEEDIVLVAAVKKYGPRWNVVKDFLPGRTNYQCRERYRNSLDENLKMSQWTKAEDKTLVKLVKKYGVGKWTTISKYIPGRSDNMVLQRYRTISNHRPEVFAEKNSPETGEDSDFSVEDESLAPTQTSSRVMRHRKNIYNSVQSAIKNVLNGKLAVKRESKQNTHLEIKKSEIEELSRGILCPKGHKPKPANYKSEEELAVDAVLDVLFTPAVACGGYKFKKRKYIARNPRQAEEFNACRSLFFQILKAVDPKMKESTDENSDEEPPTDSALEDVSQFVDQSVLGSCEEGEIPVFPPSPVTLEAFKILLVGRKRLALASQYCPSLDVILSLRRWGKNQPLKCLRCKDILPAIKNKDDKREGNIDLFESDSLHSVGSSRTTFHSEGSSGQTQNGILHNDNSTTCNGNLSSDTPRSPQISIKKEIDDGDGIVAGKRKLDQTDQAEPQNSKRPRNDVPTDADMNTENSEESTSDSVSIDLYEDSTTYLTANILCLKCERLNAFQRSFSLLQRRFVSLFFWPALMSAIQPSACMENMVSDEDDDVEVEEKSKFRRKSRFPHSLMRRRRARKPWVTKMLKKKFGIPEDEDNLPFEPDDNSRVAKARKRRAYIRYRKNRSRPATGARKCLQTSQSPETLRRSARQAAKVATIGLQEFALNEEEQSATEEI